MAALIDAAEYLFLENLALRLLMEHRAVPNWQKLRERLIADREVPAGVHLKCRGLNQILAHSVERPLP